MEEAVKKEILYDLAEAIKILEVREAQNVEQLKKLSDHAVEDVALHKDLDLISITVLIYSIYKVANSFSSSDYQQLISQLRSAESNLRRGDLGKYNRAMKMLFEIVRRSDTKVRLHLQDVMHAARVRKGTVLLEHGLSIGQAAGLMGLSNWDLQQYAGKTIALGQHQEKIPAKKRMLTALRLFGVK